MRVNDVTNKPSASLDRRLSTISSQIWLSDIQRQSEILFGRESTVIKNLAVLLPTSTAMRYKNLDKKYLHSMSVQYLTRVQHGERCMNDAGLAKRVEKELFVEAGILNSSLCAILKKPELRKQDFKKMIAGISEKLEGVVFKKMNNSDRIKQRRCYWSYENLFLISSQDFLTYQLLLISKNSHQPPPSNFSLSKLVLLFWRALITTRLGEHADTLCEAFLRYLKINLSEKLIPNFSTDINHFEILRNIAFPYVTTYPSYTNSFNAYKAHTRTICRKAAANFFPNSEVVTPISFYAEIIYWADRYAHKWINGDIDKANLFNRDTQEYIEIIKGLHFSSKHRIW